MPRPETERKELPVEVLVGQLFVVQPNPNLPHAQALQEHQDSYYGSFMMRSQNLPTTREGRALTRRLRTFWRRLPPPVVAVDEEGGLISDTGHLMTAAPSPQALGQIGDDELTADVYESMGRKLKALGINTVFAPVLDVNSRPENPVIGTRSFGSDPTLVGRQGAAAIRGLHAARMAACVKHFPGHGDTREDSHNTLPVVDVDLDTLMHRDVAPFAQAFDSKHPPELVMCAHVAYPALGDKKRPATLSKTILRDLLRGELRFNGLVISDAMEMAGVGSMSAEVAAFEAITAGVDLLLYAHDRDMANRAYRGLVDAVHAGRLPRDRVEESVERVFAFRKRLRKERWIHEREARDRLGILEDQPFYQAALDSLVLEGNLGALQDLVQTEGRKTLVMPENVGERPIPVEVVREQLEPQGFTVEILSPNPKPEELDRLLGSLDPKGGLVLATANRGPMPRETRLAVEKLTSGNMIKIGVALLDSGDTEALMSTNCRIKTFGTAPPQLWAMCQKLIP